MQSTLFCCGLDPDLALFPIELLESGLPAREKIDQFLRGVVDATADRACAFKAQKAMFDCLDHGAEILKSLFEYIHTHWPGIPCIVDSKIGDTVNTMRSYGRHTFDYLDADGVVANPYLGDDAILSLAERADKLVVVLAKTSNPGASIVQDVPLAAGRPLWMHVLSLCVERWNGNGNVVPVLPATGQVDVSCARGLVPDEMPIFLAGVGAQGGDLRRIVPLLNRARRGVIVNSSRAILYPSRGSDPTWAAAVERSAREFSAAIENAVAS